ncbi:MAG: hypothetical protein IKN89_02505 [Oscillospiraceae bacterium]|nr:hypothetical protein [Oscillospiraceae bacterium]
MPELAKAYVQIIPSAEGIKGNLTKIMDGEADSAGKSAGGKFGSAFGSVAKAGLAAVGAGLAAASAAVVKVAKDAVEGYADYEQLTGGIETLFGTAGKGIEEYAREQGLSIEKAVDGYTELLDVQDTMMTNAANAFKTAGISANEYMEMAIQSGASMISSVEGDTARAAELMDLAIVDMSDNVNRMGTSMESVQNAYRGFAKGNFTMLDNLALGYGGTKEEMGRLLEDAEKLAGLDMFTFDINSYADIVQAIHIVQENIGITGTTAKEASETISGSVGSMKAAWQNLLVGMADPAADLSGLIGNVVDTAETAFGNILPVAEQALTGIASFVEQIAPVIAEKLPGLVEAVLPSILNAATTLVTALVEALPTLMQVLIDQGQVIVNTLLEKILEMLPEIVTLGLTLLTSLAQGIADNLDELIPTVVDVVLEIVDTLTDPQTLGNLIDAALAIIIALAEGIVASIPELLKRAPEIITNLVTTLVENLPKIFDAGADILLEIIDGILFALPDLIAAIPTLIMAVVTGLANGVKDLFGAGEKILRDVKDGFWEKLDGAKDWGKDLIDNFVSGITQKWEDLKSSVRGVAQTVKDLLGFSEPKEGPLANFHTFAPDMMMLFAKGIRDNEYLVEDQLKKSLDFSQALENTWEPDRLSSAVRGAGAYRFGGAPGTASGEAGRIDAAALAQAVADALRGCGVYMDGQVVGRLVTKAQANTARAIG